MLSNLTSRRPDYVSTSREVKPVRRTLSLTSLVLCLFAITAIADPPKLPDPPASVKPGQIYQFTVTGKDIGFHPAFTADKATLVRLFSDDPTVMNFMFQSSEAGSYPIVFWSSGEKKGAAFVIPVKLPDPPPPPPGPQPKPVNALRAGLKAAFDADPGDAATKDSARKYLIELYSQAVAKSADTSITTTDQLAATLQKAGSSLTNDKLTGTRTAIAGLIASVLAPGVQLTDASRLAAADLFGRISDALAW